MKTMQYVKFTLLVASVAMVSCAKYVEKDSETNLEIGVQTGLQTEVIIDDPDNTGGGGGGNGTPTPVPTPTPGPMDCSGQVVTVANNNYNDFSIWMGFFGGNNTFPSKPKDSVNVTTTTTGLYQFYTLPWGSSGNNESFYATVKNSENADGYPTTKNCSDYYVVQDINNLSTPEPTEKTYIGTFKLVAGEVNTLTINHYCHYFRNHANDAGFMSSACASFHYGYNQTGWPASWTQGQNSGGCMTNSPNTVVINPTGICVRPIPAQ